MNERTDADALPAASPPRHIDFLLVGGGLASATAAEALRLQGADGSIAIVGAENRPPYHRPPLSGRLKRPGTSGTPIPVLNDEYYRKRSIELLTGVRALGLDAALRTVRTDMAGSLSYGKLLIATGASPVRLQLPGADLPGVHYLRTVEDARAIDEAASRSLRCVVIGASFIGMEVSSGLRQRGLDVTLVHAEEGMFGPLRDPAVSRFFASLYADKGIHETRGTVVGFEGGATVEAAVLQDGTRLPCDFAVVGIGVRPNVDWLDGSGIALKDGVVVDRHLQANADGVYAAGDVASFFDPVFNLRRRIEHWDNAVKQGRLAARNMLGQRLPYDEVSGFFCQVFDVNFQFLGWGQDAPRRRSLGTPTERSWARLYMKESVPRALFTMGRPPRETSTIESLIRYRTNIGRCEDQLGRPGFIMSDIPSQTVLVLQGGGAIGAFECGVVKALEQRDIHPDIVAGVSIGAFNGAIVASHPRQAAEALESFWDDLAIASPPVTDERIQQMWGSLNVLLFGVPGFFTPRWAGRPWNLQDAFRAWTSFYDPAPARQLLEKYVDFEALASSPVRLLVSAVDVETGQLETFDSYVESLTVDHLMASGSLPPGLPWTTIAGRHYWDGGIVSNSPLDQVNERAGSAGKRVIVVDLFAEARPLPTNMVEVLARRDEIVFSERVRRASMEQALLHDARRLVEAVLSAVDLATAARIREVPPYVQLMGAPDPPAITRIVRDSARAEPAGGDFDFSVRAIRGHINAGVQAACRTLDAEEAGSAAADATVRRDAARQD